MFFFPGLCVLDLDRTECGRVWLYGVGCCCFVIGRFIFFMKVNDPGLAEVIVNGVTLVFITQAEKPATSILKQTKLVQYRPFAEIQLSPMMELESYNP